MIFLRDNQWELRKTARTGNGLFATNDLSGGMVVGDYLGRVMNTTRDDLTEDDQRYLMYYSDKASLLPVDVQQPGVHSMNHSCNPNCWLSIYRGHTLFFTLRRIFSGEELTISYLLSPRNASCSPCTHVCRCDSNPCRQTMHLDPERYEEWRHFAQTQAKLTKRAAIRYGHVLPRLSSYPKRIPDHPIYRLTGCRSKPTIVCDDEAIPDTQEIRHRIRQTGRSLSFPKVQATIMGVENGRIILV